MDRQARIVPKAGGLTARVDDELWAAVRLLPRIDQRMVYRHYYFGNTHDEIAVLLDVSPRTVKRHLAFAEGEIEKYFVKLSLSGHRESVLTMRGESGSLGDGGKSGGQQTGQSNTRLRRIVYTDPPALSLNPKPDVYYEYPQREDFLEALLTCCGSVMTQVAVSKCSRG